ncbi:MAG: 50S ribosomal protein L24 [Candidatus Odinarchaeia archaeon]
MKTKKPSKQRKAWYNQPLHRRAKTMSIKLIPDLAEELGVKRLPVRKRDTVVVISGGFKDTEGEVTEVDRKNYTLRIKEIAIEKADGAEYNVPIHYSNVMLVKLAKDKWREKIIERKMVKEE